MQINDLKLKGQRKKRKIIGRGGKKGTYSGRGNKGQKARSGGNVDPLFEGGRSTLIDHMKKKKGFKSSKNYNQILISLRQIDDNFKDGDIINKEALVKARLVGKNNKKYKVKILNDLSVKFSKKISFEKDILFSSVVEKIITKAGGNIIDITEKSNSSEGKIKKSGKKIKK